MADVLDYIPPQSLIPFFTSEAFISLICGPIGSGKTSAGIIKIAYHAKQMMACKDGIRRSRCIWIRNCYTPDTEILTEKRGWIKFPDLLPTDAVATRYGDRMGFEVPSLHYTAQHDGTMVSLKAEGFDLQVTPDHELWLSERTGRDKHWGDFSHRKAYDVYGRGETLRMVADCEYDAPAAAESEDYFELLGFWLADGSAGVYPRADCAGRHYRLVLSQNPREDNYVENLLARNKLTYGTSIKASGNINYSVHMSDPRQKSLAELLATYGKARTKQLPLWMMQCNRAQARALLLGYQNGDGTFRTYKSKAAARLRTTSPVLADQLQELAVKAGYVASLAKRAGGAANRADMYSLTLHEPCKRTPVIHKEHWSTYNYTGLVHCVEVSTHVVLVRRNGKAVWCGQTREQLRDTSIPDFLKWFPDGLAGVFEKTNSKFILKFDDVECEVLFRGLDDTNDVRRLLSLQASFAVMDEFREINKDIFEAVQGRLGRYPDRMMQGGKFPCVKDDGTSNKHIWGMTNPPNDTTFWSEFMDNPPKNSEIFRQPGGFSPRADWIEYLPEDYYANLAEGKDEDWVDVYINSKFGKSLAGKPVYRTFDQDFHVAKGPLLPILNGMRPIIVGMDFGLNPSAVFGQIDMRGRANVLAEATSDGMGITRFISTMLKPILAQKFPGAPVLIAGDPAGTQRVQTDEKTVYDILKSEGFKAMPASTNSIVARVAAVETYLARQIDGQAGMLIDPSCKALINGFRGGYRYRIKTTGEMEDKPEKNAASHLHDGCFIAGTLVETRTGEVPIELLQTGQEVYTPAGYKRVTAHAMTGVKQVGTYKFSNGTELTCTPDHPIFVVGKGFIPIDTLQYSDILVSISNPQEYEQWKENTQRKYSMERGITTNQMGTTKPSIKQWKVRDICTEMFGRIRMAKYPKGIISTTKTMIERIMRWITLSVYTEKSMQSNIWRKENLPIQIFGVRRLQKPYLSPQHGISLQKVAHGTSSMLYKLPASPILRQGHAHGVINNTSGAGTEGKRTSVVCRAKAWLGKQAESMTQHAFVPSVKKYLWSIGILKSKPAVRLVGKRTLVTLSEVYNISVEDEEVYFANGLLVHNCQYLFLHIDMQNGGRGAANKRKSIQKADARGWT